MSTVTIFKTRELALANTPNDYFVSVDNVIYMTVGNTPRELVAVYHAHLVEGFGKLDFRHAEEVQEQAPILLASAFYHLNEQVCNANTLEELMKMKDKLANFGSSKVLGLLETVESKLLKVTV